MLILKNSNNLNSQFLMQETGSRTKTSQSEQLERNNKYKSTYK